MDYLIRLASNTGEKIKSQNLSNNNFEQRSLRFVLINNFRNYKIKISDFGALCSIEINVEIEVAFAMNKPDRVLYYDIPIHSKLSSYVIYVSDSNKDLVDNLFFHKICHALDLFLKKINISKEEGLFVYRNGICLSLKTERDLISDLDSIVNLLDTNKNLFKTKKQRSISIEKIPTHLKALAPLIKKYSISDDFERGQLIEGMNKKKIKHLIDSVDPYMDEINAYLDSFNENPLTEEATLIGNLAELVTELKTRNT